MLAAAVPFDPALGEQSFCYLTTIGRVSGEPREIEIWFGLDGDTLYMLSGGRERSNLRACPAARAPHLLEPRRGARPAPEPHGAGRLRAVPKGGRRTGVGGGPAGPGTDGGDRLPPRLPPRRLSREWTTLERPQDRRLAPCARRRGGCRAPCLGPMVGRRSLAVGRAFLAAPGRRGWLMGEGGWG